MPARAVILGGGVIGVEFASILPHFGSEVTIVEMLDSLIPTEDADAAKELAPRLQEARHHHAPGRSCDPHRARREAIAALRVVRRHGRPGRRRHRAGRHRPRAERRSIGLEQAGVGFDPRKGIETDLAMRTNVPHIFAAGDVAGRFQLAHTSFREGEVAAENATGHEAEIDYTAVPRCIYTDPEVAGVGLTEAQARERHGDEVAVGRMPFSANARAQMYAEKTGWVKTIHETHYGELLGLVIVGPQATELVNAGVVGMSAEATIETIGDSIAAHPTLAEAVKEAALVALGRPIHLPRPSPAPKRPPPGERRSRLTPPDPDAQGRPGRRGGDQPQAAGARRLHPAGRIRALHLPAAGLAGDAADRQDHPRGDGHDRPGDADARAEPGRAVAAHRPLGHRAALQADRLLRQALRAGDDARGVRHLPRLPRDPLLQGAAPDLVPHPDSRSGTSRGPRAASCAPASS